MKLRITKKYPYHDSHCGRAPESCYSFICNDNKESNNNVRRIISQPFQNTEQINKLESKVLVLRHKR